ncbi:MAG: PEP-CTERM sorting domain-containing protein [Cyanobacteria bacterium J06592_8]
MTGLTFVQKSLMAATGAAVVSFTGGQAAQAITFDFTGPRDTFPSISDTVDGISLTGIGFGPGRTNNVTQNRQGIGVDGGRNNQIDGGRRNENDNFDVLQLTFDQRVTLTSAIFGQVNLGNDTNDGFQLLVDGTELTTENPLAASGQVPFDFTSFDLAARTGKVFEFTVPNSNDGYRLASLTVEPVPEPLTILGSLSALGMGAVLKKKQQNKS